MPWNSCKAYAEEYNNTPFTINVYDGATLASPSTATLYLTGDTYSNSIDTTDSNTKLILSYTDDTHSTADCELNLYVNSYSGSRFVLTYVVVYNGATSSSGSLDTDALPPEDPGTVTSNFTLNFNASGSEPESTNHTHEWVEGIIYDATPISDGLEGTYCKTCGAIKESHIITAYEYALNNYALPKINAAKSGQTITFEFGEWNSFPKSFMEKLVEKSAQNVTFVFKYKWNHKLQTITIPAGTPIDLNFDYYGPAKMAELYGMY